MKVIRKRKGYFFLIKKKLNRFNDRTWNSKTIELFKSDDDRLFFIEKNKNHYKD